MSTSTHNNLVKLVKLASKRFTGSEDYISAEVSHRKMDRESKIKKTYHIYIGIYGDGKAMIGSLGCEGTFEDCVDAIQFKEVEPR